MEINKFLLFSLSLVVILGVVESFEYHEKELETEEGLQAMYERWRGHHQVTEKSPERFNVFKESAKLVHSHNKKDKPYKLSLNRFAAMPKEEYKTYSTGTKVPERKHNLGFIYSDVDINSLPPRIDWREHNAVTPVKNQGGCGSCYAFAATAAIEGINAIRTGQLVSLSEQQIIDCDIVAKSNGCDGGVICGVAEWIRDHGGLATNESYPYVAKREVCDNSKFGHHSVTIDGSEYVWDNNEEAMMKTVAHQPVSICMDSTGEGYALYKEGIYSGPCKVDLWGHAMTIVGYDTSPEGVKYWIVKNSWGEGWGEKGYMRMLRGLPEKEGLCGMNSHVNYPLKSPETRNIEL